MNCKYCGHPILKVPNIDADVWHHGTNIETSGYNCIYEEGRMSCTCQEPEPEE